MIRPRPLERGASAKSLRPEPGRRGIPTAVLLGLLALACADTPIVEGPGPAAEVRIPDEEHRIEVFEQRGLEARAYDARGTLLESRITYRSTDPAVVDVGLDGIATGTGVGTAWVFAEMDGARDSARVAVVSPPVALIVFDRDSLLVGEQGTDTLTATVIDPHGRVIPRAPVAWRSTVPSVLRLADGGAALGVARGEAEVVATSGGVSASLPARVAAGWREVVVSFWFACGIRVDGRAYCWSPSGFYRLGAGREVRVAEEPVAVVGGLRFDALALGEHHACGVTEEGEAWCWGLDRWGQLGTAAEGDSLSWVPVPVAGGHRFRDVAAGEDHSCGLREDGVVFCWGRNTSGQLGTPHAADLCGGGASPCSQVPIAASTDVRFVQLGGGGTANSCALSVEGAAYCWGHVATVGTADTAEACAGTTCPLPLRVEGGPWKEVRVGYTDSCALDMAGAVHCWGMRRALPKPLGNPEAFEQLSATSVSTVFCGITAERKARCWNDTVVPPVIRPLAGDLRLLRVAAGNPSRTDLICGITPLRLGYCWDDGEWWSDAPRLLDIPARKSASYASSRAERLP